MLALTVDMLRLISVSLGTMLWMQGTIPAYFFFFSEQKASALQTLGLPLPYNVGVGPKVEGQWM